MNATKNTSALLIAFLIGSPFVFGGAADGSGSGSDRHFRSPARFDNPQPAEPAKTSNAVANDESLFPPNGKPGECYTRVLVPAASKNVNERVLVQEESFRLTEVPATFEEVDEKVLVRGASQRQEVIPATFKDIEEQVLVSPAYTKQIPVPAVTEVRSDRVLVKPERSYWKKGSGPLAKLDNTTGEIMCYVTEPAVYETVNRTVQTSAATTRAEEVPAVYKTIKRTVVDQPASVKNIEVPAEYATMKVSKIKTQASVTRESIPASYRNVTKQVTDGESHMEWRRILCETNVTPVIVSDLQSALTAKGFPAGDPTGTFNTQTLKALESFQVANKLPRGGVTIESLDALGVKH